MKRSRALNLLRVMVYTEKGINRGQFLRKVAGPPGGETFAF
jgi:hypothetical protein